MDIQMAENVTTSEPSSTPSKLMPALWGGLLIGFFAGIPYLAWINCACCIGVLAGGLLAVYLYKNDLHADSSMNMGDGATLGLIAGLIGTVVAVILETIFGTMGIDLLYRIPDIIHAPEFEDWIYKIDPQNLTRGVIVLKFMTNLVTFAIFGLVGGILGVALFNRNSKY